jgi:hypothetical protein
MRGLVTSWDVVRHPVLIVHAFGARCYLRCLRAVLYRERTTFLDLAFRD